MFDIGWTEIVVIIIVACLVLDIQDVASIIKLFKQLFKQVSAFIEDAKEIIGDIEKETKSVTKKIIDLEGKEQIAYDLEEIMPTIDKPKTIKKNGKK